jgi:alanine racemase
VSGTTNILLDQSAYGATLTIDLRAIAANWRIMAERADGAECGAVIKADAYGCGIARVAPALYGAGCRTFFVAHLSEAYTARAALADDATIYVLNGLLPGSAANYAPINAMPVLGSHDELSEWISAGKGNPCAIHIDTGMNRLGFAAYDLANAAAQAAIVRANCNLIMTHFSASEDARDASNTRQIEKFGAIAVQYPALRKSLYNSSGHFLSGAPVHNLTRPGYALYGGNPTPGQPNPMQSVVTLTSTILQVREIADGEGVGYNSRWHAKGRRKLATIWTGYADGYPRNGSNTDTVKGGNALVGGVLCPFAGTVSMDLIIVDVTDAPEDHVKRGAPVTLIGGMLDVDTVGLAAKTIGYEVLTSLKHRYNRVYLT